MNYLVTGGAGFIGSHLCNKLIDSGHKVWVLDNLSTGKMENVNKKCEFKLGDVSGKDIYAFKDIKFDAVFHLAAQSSGEISFSDPIYDIQTNAQSTLNILGFCTAIGCKKFIYASTMSVYGHQELSAAVAEDKHFVPESFYGVGKFASEHYMRIYTQQFDINCVALRLFSVYGPGQNLENMRQGIVSIYLAFILNNLELHVKGTGDRVRDLVYVDDIVSAFVASLDSKVKFAIYNVCTGKTTSVDQLIKKLITCFRKETYPVIYKGNTPGDVFGFAGDNSKIRSELGWTPKVELDAGLQKMVDWALSKKAGEK